MGLRHAVAAGQSFFLYLVGLPADTCWGDVHDILVYIDGAIFLADGADATFEERRAAADVYIGDDVSSSRPVFAGLQLDMGDGSFAIKASTQAKVAALPANWTGRTVLAGAGRCLIALRYLGLPYAFAADAWRVSAAVMRRGVVHLDAPQAVPDTWLRMVQQVAALCALRRVWRPLPGRDAALATDASLTGWAALLVIDGVAALYSARWRRPATSQAMRSMVC